MAENQGQPFQLFQRAGSAKWWVRFSIKGQGQIRKSLDTPDKREALQRAYKVYYEASYRADALTPERRRYNMSHIRDLRQTRGGLLLSQAPSYKTAAA